MNITLEMENFYMERTESHIDLVKQFYKLLTFTELKEHDSSKFEEPEYTPYIYLTWKKYKKSKGDTFILPDDIEDSIHKATLHHITTNEHHVEKWDLNFNDNMLNRQDRDDIPNEIVNGTLMPTYAIYEMGADWLAMSYELGTNPVEWADKNIGTRWSFTDKQVELIYDIVNQYDDLKEKIVD